MWVRRHRNGVRNSPITSHEQSQLDIVCIRHMIASAPAFQRAWLLPFALPRSHANTISIDMALALRATALESRFSATLTHTRTLSASCLAVNYSWWTGDAGAVPSAAKPRRVLKARAAEAAAPQVPPGQRFLLTLPKPMGMVLGESSDQLGSFYTPPPYPCMWSLQ